jgi:hypothetical protein
LVARRRRRRRRRRRGGGEGEEEEGKEKEEDGNDVGAGMNYVARGRADKMLPSDFDLREKKRLSCTIRQNSDYNPSSPRIVSSAVRNTHLGRKSMCSICNMAQKEFSR